MEQHIFPNQIFYEPLERIVNLPLPFVPFIIGKTFPDSDYSQNSPSIERKSFEIYQFEYITKGTCLMEIDGKDYSLHSGDFVCIKKSCYRRLYSKKDDPVGKLHISAKGDFVDGIVSAYFPKDKAVICKADVLENFELLIELCKNAEKADNEFLNSVAIELLKIVQKASDSLKISQQVNDVKCTPEAIIQFIDSNLQNKFSLDDLSAEFYVSSSQIVNIFKKKYNTTPMKYAQRKRVELAKYYLSNTQMPISEIPILVPIGDCQYFSNVFKSQTGISPREYRNKHKKELMKKESPFQE